MSDEAGSRPALALPSGFLCGGPGEDALGGA
jgi:hypothetical protein